VKGKEELKVEVYDKDDFGTDDLLGFFKVNLDELRD
jgi:Ca2+-dependent lipid-binding protein